MGYLFGQFLCYFWFPGNCGVMKNMKIIEKADEVMKIGAYDSNPRTVCTTQKQNGGYHLL